MRNKKLDFVLNNLSFLSKNRLNNIKYFLLNQNKEFRV